MPKRDARGILVALEDPASPGARTGALAATTLERACRDHEADSDDARLELYLDSVRGLARSLGQELAALSERMGAGSREAGTSGASRADLVSAALRAADLATVSACAIPELPPESPVYLRAASSARLAAAAVQSIALEYRAAGDPGSAGDYEARDLRGAEWRAGLAARQVGEMLQESS